MKTDLRCPPVNWKSIATFCNCREEVNHPEILKVFGDMSEEDNRIRSTSSTTYSTIRDELNSTLFCLFQHGGCSSNYISSLPGRRSYETLKDPSGCGRKAILLPAG